MSKSLGIIGCGAVTQNNYALVLGMYKDVDVKYVYDINVDLANKVAGVFGAEFIDKKELINKSDIIVIATPPSTHYDLVKECLGAGKKIICEKPFVGTETEAADLINLAKTSKTELYVAHFRRNFPSVLLAKSIIESGVLGDVLSIEAYEGGRFSWQTQSGYVYKDPYGGVLFDTGSHTIDMALFMANLDVGNLTPKVSSIKKDKSEPAHDIEANLVLEINNSNIDFKVKLSRKLLLSNKIRITCANGHIDVPTVMTNYIRVNGPKTSTVVYSNVSYDRLIDCFAVQFKDMFYQKQDSIFAAARYLNLTKVLEVISKD